MTRLKSLWKTIRHLWSGIGGKTVIDVLKDARMQLGEETFSDFYLSMRKNMKGGEAPDLIEIYLAMYISGLTRGHEIALKNAENIYKAKIEHDNHVLNNLLSSLSKEGENENT